MTLLDRFRDHYWDSLERDRDLIILHIESVLAMAREEIEAPLRAEIERLRTLLYTDLTAELERLRVLLQEQAQKPVGSVRHVD